MSATLSGVQLPAGLPACAIVDLDAISANVRVLRERAGRADVMAVVKADAYGHGLVPAARAAVAGGAAWLGVAQLFEGLELRAAGVEAPMLSWLTVPGDRFDEAIDQNVDLGVSATWALDEIVAAAHRTGRTARIQLKIDTGLSRNGVSLDDYPDLLGAALKHEASGAVRLAGIFSHYAWADAPTHPTVTLQTERFTDAVRLAERQGADLELRHLANSAATLTNPNAHFDLVRPGIAVYGVSPVPDLGAAHDFGLTPAMSVLARVALVKRVAGGQGVAYGHEYTTRADTTLALLPLGYADGIPRHAGNAGALRLRGRTYPIAGRVSMDQIVLDLDDAANLTGVSEGDVAVVFGDGRDGGPTAEDWAVASGTIAYEIVTRIGARLPRAWVGGAS